MAILTINQLITAGLDPVVIAVAAAAGGDKFPGMAGRDVIYIKTAGTGITLTIEAVPDKAIVLAATEERFIRVEKKWVDRDGFVNLSYTAVTSVTVGVFRI